MSALLIACAASILHGEIMLHTGNTHRAALCAAVQDVQDKNQSLGDRQEGDTQHAFSQQINIYPEHAAQGGEEKDYTCLSGVQVAKFILHVSCTGAAYPAQGVAA